MSNKMLIDASHPEETRVAVVRGNRIEEFDFESQEKKQLRGNIYLAKVTRVEPSLQAAFVDYGGNRHGFLAFSEIHPDYYQVPVADRRALLEAEAAEARAMREAEEKEDDLHNETPPSPQPDNDASLKTETEEPAEKPKRKQTRRSRQKPTTKAKADLEGTEESDTAETANTAEANVISGESSKTETSEKPKRRPATRRKSVKAKESNLADSNDGKEGASDTGANKNDPSADDHGNNDNSPTTMTAMVERDEISEPLPENTDKAKHEANDGGEQAGTEQAGTEQAGTEQEEMPKRKRPQRPRRKKSSAGNTSDPDNHAPTVDVAEKNSTNLTSESEDSKESENDEKEENSRRQRRNSRRSSNRKSKSAEPVGNNGADSTESEEDDDETQGIESIGQDDAMEEIPEQHRSQRQYKIQEVIKRRQVLLIQVVKEERGNKGAALTTYLSLAGRYSVLMPNTARGGGISRKITNPADRKRLKAIASQLDISDGMGIILRTAGASKTKDEFERDFQYLTRLWEQVRNLTLSSTAPCLVYEEGSLIKRSIRDLFNKDTDEIIVSGDEGYREAKDFMEMLMPEHVNRIKQYNGSQAVFSKFGVATQLENMISPQVTLKSGGYLVLNQTEALVAVDVNSGRATREHSVEKTALQTNLEASEEIARQLRLRDLAGLIVIDFIDMEERRNNRAVERKLKECLKNDRARIQVGRISHFGLLEMSRQRIRASVLESTMNVCPHCTGNGYIRSESAISLHVFRAMEQHVAQNRNHNAVLRTTPQIVSHILNHKRTSLVELETRYGIQILVFSDPEILGQNFKIERGEKVSTLKPPLSAKTAIVADAQETENGAERVKGKRSPRRKHNERKNTAETSPTDNQNPIETGDLEHGGENAAPPRRNRNRGKSSNTRSSEETKASNNENTARDETEMHGITNNEKPQKNAIETFVNPDNTEEEASLHEKPKSRSTRRKKAPIAPIVPDVSTVESSDKHDDNNTEPKPSQSTSPSPRRRTTRRKADDPMSRIRKSGASEETNIPSDAADSISVGIEAKVNSGPEASTDTARELEISDEGDKQGWHNRGNGFF